MSKIDTGGPVYPQYQKYVGNNTYEAGPEGGITRRDDLAKAAMKGMLANCPDDTIEALEAFGAIPELAYVMADKMIAEGRKEPK